MERNTIKRSKRKPQTQINILSRKKGKSKKEITRLEKEIVDDKAR